MEFPKSTVVNKVLSKERFYANTDVSARLRQQFVDEIEKIRWLNKISPDTLPVITTKKYTELEVFEISLKQAEVNIAVLRHIDTFIPYPILYILRKPGAEKAVIAYKQSGIKDEDRMKVDSYYSTQWVKTVDLKLMGLSVDEIYKKFVFQIAPELKKTGELDFEKAVQLNKDHDKVLKKIAELQKRIANEPSVGKRQELARERFTLEQQIIQ